MEPVSPRRCRCGGGNYSPSGSGSGSGGSGGRTCRGSCGTVGSEGSAGALPVFVSKDRWRWSPSHRGGAVVAAAGAAPAAAAVVAAAAVAMTAAAVAAAAAAAAASAAGRAVRWVGRAVQVRFPARKSLRGPPPALAATTKSRKPSRSPADPAALTSHRQQDPTFHPAPTLPLAGAPLHSLVRVHRHPPRPAQCIALTAPFTR